MTDFLPQSTDRNRDSPNPLMSNVVFEGSKVIPLALATGFYSGSATITLPLNTQYANLIVEAWIRLQFSGGGNVVVYQPLLQTTASAAGVLASVGSINIGSPVKAGTYDITFTYRTSSTLLIDPTVYYRIKSDRISVSGLTFV